ncbi:MAG: two-component system, cell cycle response regulator [Gaiellaceae bacterium]|jgi:diguanylate cyclase (GGDEF)-like protein|nr:two-component system, cell cycle response regulator [Gaiellaceae bacterium]
MTAVPTVETPRRFTTDDERELPADLVADLLGRLRAYREAPIPSPEAMAARLELEADAAIRWDRPFGCVIVQLDALDAVERKHGRAARSRALREAARRLRDAVRTNDVVGYWGPDTLMVVLPATWTDGAAVVADRIAAKLSAQPVPLGRKAGKVQVHAGVGAAGWRTSMGSVEDMWTEAFRDLVGRREHPGARLAFVANL